MKTTLRTYRDYLHTEEKVFAVKCIDNFIHDLFLDLTGNLSFDFDRELDVDADLHDFAPYDEYNVCIDFDETLIPDVDMDVCIRIKFNVDASQHREDGSRFFENISADVLSIVFDVWGQEWDFSDDADAKKIVYKILNDYV